MDADEKEEEERTNAVLSSSFVSAFIRVHLRPESRGPIHAVIFTGDCFTDWIDVPPGATPDYTSKVAHAPAPVKRCAWI